MLKAEGLLNEQIACIGTFVMNKLKKSFWLSKTILRER
jgi:hypothetical protein